MSVKVSLSLLFAVITLAHCASVLDFLNWDDGKKLIEVPELRNDQPNRNCLCRGPACICCVDFNITFVDLWGPGCVHMKYLSPEEGFSVKVSYGKQLLHTAKIQGSNPAPVCLDVFGRFGEVCAKFSDMAPTSDGLRGCLELAPKLLGETQITFPMGCFKSTPGGMEMEDPPAEPEETTEENTTEEDSNTFDAESFLMNVYQTAEQGVSFLSSLLDLPAKKPGSTTTTTKPVVSTEQETQTPQNRGPKYLKHPNQL